MVGRPRQYRWDRCVCDFLLDGAERTRSPEHDGKDKIAGAGRPLQDTRSRTDRTGQPRRVSLIGQYREFSLDRTKIEQPGKGSLGRTAFLIQTDIRCFIRRATIIGRLRCVYEIRIKKLCP